VRLVSASLVDRYRQLVASGVLAPDPAQVAVVDKLEALNVALRAHV